MRSVSVVRLLAVCALVLAVQFTSADAELSGFGFELLLTRLEALESRVNERMDQLSRKMENQLKQVGEKLKVLEKQTANGLTSLHNNITEVASRMNTSLVNLSDSGKELSKHLERRLEELSDHSGVYTTNYSDSKYAFRAYRDGQQHHGYGGHWIVFQRRIDGSVSFNCSSYDYKFGFGDLSGEHWLGLQKLYHILVSERHELLVELEDFVGGIVYAKYDHFLIGNDNDGYEIKSIGNYSGNAGDALTYHVGRTFATYDKNDVNHCASRYGGGGWFHNCYNMHLNGPYRKKNEHYKRGVSWNSFKEDYGYSFKASKMMVRPYAYNTS